MIRPHVLRGRRRCSWQCERVGAAALFSRGVQLVGQPVFASFLHKPNNFLLFLFSIFPFFSCSWLLFGSHGQISISARAAPCRWSDRWQRFVCSCGSARGVYVQRRRAASRRLWTCLGFVFSLVNHIQNGLLSFFFLFSFSSYCIAIVLQFPVHNWDYLLGRP